MVVGVFVAVPVKVTMVVGVKPPVWSGVADVFFMTILTETFIDTFADVIMVLEEALTEVIDALAGVVGAGLLFDVDIIVMAAVSIVLKFVAKISYSADVLSGTVVGVLIIVLRCVGAGVTTDVVLPGVGIGVLDGVNVNIFAAVMTALSSAMPVPLEEAFGC